MSRTQSPIPLDALVLLAVFFPMTFLRGVYVASHEFVLPWQTLLIFRTLAYILAVIYLLIGFLGRRDTTSARLVVLSLLIASIVIAPTLTSVGLRVISRDPSRYVHDNPLQVEEAAKFLLRGINPYAVDYTDTPMGKWPYTGPAYSSDPNAQRPANWDVNPALFHLVSLPFGVLAYVPFQAVFGALFHWSDARLLYLLAYVLALWLVNQLVEDPVRRLSLLIIVGLNPLLVSFLVEGRNDILVFSLLLAAAYAWQRGRLDLSGVLLGLAVTTKHIAILFLPFYFLLGWSDDLPWRSRLMALGRHIAPTLLTAAILVLPFLAWDPAAFYDDVFGYLSGALPTSYPMSGIGLAGNAVFWGWVPNSTVPFPSVLLQVIFGGPLLLVLLWRQWQSNTIRVALAAYGLFLLVYMWFARFYFDNYVGYIVLVLSVAAFWPAEGERLRPEAE